MIRSIVAVAAAALVAASISGAAEQPPEPISTSLPAPQFDAVESGPFSLRGLDGRVRPLGPGAPPWARRMYMDSIRVLLVLTDPDSGAQLAGAREGWDRVWPRDAAAGAIAMEAAGLHLEASRVAGYLEGLDLGRAAQFEPGGEPIPGRGPAGDAEGWVAAAVRAVGHGAATGAPGNGDPAQALDWEGRQDYGENVTGDLLGNAIAAGAPAEEILDRFLTPRGLSRVAGGEALDSAAAWAVVPFGRADPATVEGRRLRVAVRWTLLDLIERARRYGVVPAEGWKYDDGWTAPTAWSAAALAELGETDAADSLLAKLRRAATPEGMLPERVDADTGEPLSTTPLAWSHAFAILALRARYPGEP